MWNVTRCCMISLLSLLLAFTAGCAFSDSGRAHRSGGDYGYYNGYRHDYRYDYRHEPIHSKNASPRYNKNGKPAPRPDHSGKPNQARPGGKFVETPGHQPERGSETGNRRQPPHDGSGNGRIAGPSGEQKRESPAVAAPRQAKGDSGKTVRQAEKQPGKPAAGRGSPQGGKSREEWPSRNKTDNSPR